MELDLSDDIELILGSHQGAEECPLCHVTAPCLVRRLALRVQAAEVAQEPEEDRTEVLLASFAQGASEAPVRGPVTAPRLTHPATAGVTVDRDVVDAEVVED